MRNHLWLSTVVAGVLSACGGGGGGQGADFGTGLSIDKSTLSFSAAANNASTPAQSVIATISATDAATIQVGYTSGNDQVPWLTATITTQGNTANVSFRVTALPAPGTFTAHPSIGIFRTDGTPIALRAMTVTYQVTP